MASKKAERGWSRVRWIPPTGTVEVTYATFPKSVPYAIKEEILFACQRAVRELYGDEAARTVQLAS